MANNTNHIARKNAGCTSLRSARVGGFITLHEGIQK